MLGINQKVVLSLMLYGEIFTLILCGDLPFAHEGLVLVFTGWFCL